MNDVVLPNLGGQEDDVQELDLDEIKNEINKMTNDILSKHFK